MCNDSNELTLENLVAVEKHIVTEPSDSSRKYAGSEIGKGELERLGIVASDLGLVLGCL